MISMMLADPWMHNTWPLPPTPPPAPVVRDINGTAISAGDHISLPGTILSITDLGIITILPDYPVPGKFSFQCSNLSVIK